ncbi:uncharacterized protein MJAP1_000821 [Malassezia japonica]|uniref:Uncharacterized protein n=1 Tax=Malassezia japonica TaxID=223818 RepID=A0AAF0J9R2_9BASI|nr:uncharacterized protein MJAP1_000821 [Malassezia japonica]WFD37874.1 hypothetical protein MJAP1_000821 [Malassezia japonica]
MSQITTPQQLGDWVESLLTQVETRLGERNKQVEMRMNEMADRIDALESSIQELVHGAETGAGVPASTSSITASETH